MFIENMMVSEKMFVMTNKNISVLSNKNMCLFHGSGERPGCSLPVLKVCFPLCCCFLCAYAPEFFLRVRSKTTVSILFFSHGSGDRPDCSLPDLKVCFPLCFNAKTGPRRDARQLFEHMGHFAPRMAPKKDYLGRE